MQSAAGSVERHISVGSLTHEVEADVPTRLGRVKVMRQSWAEPIDAFGVSQIHWLQLSLLPSTRTERVCFPEHWRANDFEQIGQVFLFPAEQLVHTKSECRTQRSVACAFDPEATQAWLGEDLEWTADRLRGGLHLANPVIRRLLARIGQEIRTPGLGGEALLELMAGQIAIELGRHFRLIAEGGSGGLAPWRLGLIDERLAARCESPSLGELADLVGLSVRQLERGFRAARGQSVGTSILASRIAHAKRLLASNPSIKSVAYELGFRTPSNFTAAFRRATGETPRAYQLRAGRRQGAARAKPN